MKPADVWNDELSIDVTWASEGTVGAIDVIEPATEASIGSGPEAAVAVAAAGRAIEAARNAFDNGPWPWMKPEERAAKLVRPAEVRGSRAAVWS